MADLQALLSAGGAPCPQSVLRQRTGRDKATVSAALTIATGLPRPYVAVCAEEAGVPLSRVLGLQRIPLLEIARQGTSGNTAERDRLMRVALSALSEGEAVPTAVRAAAQETGRTSSMQPHMEPEREEAQSGPSGEPLYEQLMREVRASVRDEVQRALQPIAGGSPRSARASAGVRPANPGWVRRAIRACARWMDRILGLLC